MITAPNLDVAVGIALVHPLAGTAATTLTDRHGPLVWLTVAACLVATALAGLRWLRVAQREHYLGEAAGRFALRWWLADPANSLLAAIAVAAMLLAKLWPVAGLASAAVVAGGPIGLSLKGRTSPLNFTRRLRTLVVVWLAIEAVVVLIGVLIGSAASAAAIAAVSVPIFIDFACSLTAPFERQLGGRFVATATDRLRTVAPTIVGVTGSYGKTSTKSHIAHLVAGSRAVVASPKSYNNRNGLAMAVNQHLAEGTEIFIAEMGTYGQGEIADLCQWCPPSIAVITAIGPVHLERFGSIDKIVEAKTEITAAAGTIVLNVDDPNLVVLADRLASSPTQKMVRCSAVDRDADVEVEREDSDGGNDGDGDLVTVRVAGRVLAASIPVEPGAQPTNLACAVAVALALDVPEDEIAARLATLPTVPNRLTVATAPSGVIVLDDTFNSNPAGVKVALRALAAINSAAADSAMTPETDPPDSGAPETDAPDSGAPDSGAPETDHPDADDSHADEAHEGRARPDPDMPGSARRVVVTPGMVELGKEQAKLNRLFATEAAEVATDLIIVGRTNRKALLEGAGRLSPVTVRTREQAVSWVRARLGPGDAVLYENDLPDHYP